MRDAFLRRLDHCAGRGTPARFWLRDDDAIEPGVALDRLLQMTADAGVPVTLAVIPAPSGRALADRLLPEAHVAVAVHGWTHHNHAGATAKQQELGANRPAATALDEVARGFARLASLHGARLAFLTFSHQPCLHIGRGDLRDGDGAVSQAKAQCHGV